MHQPKLARFDQGAAPEVVHHRQVVFCGQCDQFSHRWLAGETYHAEIGVVCPHDERHVLLRLNRCCVVAQVGTVGRADLDQPRAALGHHLGHTKPAANLHQLPARDDHTSTARQPRQRQKHRPRVVVDHQCGLCAGQSAQQPLGVHRAVAPVTRLQVILQGGIPAADRVHRLPCRGRKRGPTQVGVDDDAGGVDHWTERGGQLLLQSGRSPQPDPRRVRHVRAGPHLIAHRAECLTHCVHRQSVSVSGDEFLHCVLAEHPVYAGKLTQLLTVHSQLQVRAGPFCLRR